ncbi:heavy metal-binding domain-containing protein [Burkholderia sp. 3C]
MGWLKSLFGGAGPATAGTATPPTSSRAPLPRALPDGPFFDEDEVPYLVRQRLADSKRGALPWVSTLTVAELSLARSHGLRMIAPITATCWMHYGYSWTEGHAQGWHRALDRLRAEAAALGANAVIDTRMVSLDLEAGDSMDYSLIGTAVRIEGMPPSRQPIVSTVPALEFIQLLEAGIVPVGIAVGAHFAWSTTPLDAQPGDTWSGNRPLNKTAQFWERLRRRAHTDLRVDAGRQGNGVLAPLHFGQLFYEAEEGLGRLLGRHIVIGTVVDCDDSTPFPHPVEFVLDLSERPDNLRSTGQHHRAYDNSL